jgi:hypothetical protein
MICSHSMRSNLRLRCLQNRKPLLQPELNYPSIDPVKEMIRILLRGVQRSVAVSFLLAVPFLFGCGRGGDSITADSICRRLRQINTTNDLTAWLNAEINLHSSADSNAPVRINIPQLPTWVSEIGFSPSATLYLERNRGDNHIELVWVSGRGTYGILIGSSTFKPVLKKEDYLVVESSPGIFVWTPRRFPH